MENPKRDDEKKSLVYDIRLTSAVPGKITGENKTYEFRGIDLGMKLHYIKGLYFFSNNNSNSSNTFISSEETKEALFSWLITYFMACGRIRVSTSEDGLERPSIKLNDAGIRLVEGQCSISVQECICLAMEDFMSLQDLVVFDHALGPDLQFSPLVSIQTTWFKCGGIAIGLSWAHVLGDPFSASQFMNTFSEYMQGHFQFHQPKVLTIQDAPAPQPNYPLSDPTHEPISVKRVDPVGNHWVLPTNSKLGTHTLLLTQKQLHQLHTKVSGTNLNDVKPIRYFEVITAIVWKSIAKIRDLKTNFVTICRPKSVKRKDLVPHNGQLLGRINVDFSVSNADPLKLINAIVDNVVDESEIVEKLVNKEMGKFDFYVYGANLTFIDMEEADIYGFKLKGNCPRFACYSIDGIGDKGAVLVVPGPQYGGNGEEHGSKLVVLHLPQDEIEPLKDELMKEWCIA
ncbi:unnamed protein product [Amaranthus hypochondriacus]